MRKTPTVVFGAVAVVAILALGIAVAGLASTSSSSGIAATTSETSTTEEPKTITYRAALTAGAEVPKPTGVKAGAGGTFKFDLTHSSGYSLAWTLTFKNLTGKVAAAHIHKGKPGRAGGVLVPLCGPCRSGQKGKAKVSKAVDAALDAGAAYVNVHTAKNAAGEIRGQIKETG